MKNKKVLIIIPLLLVIYVIFALLITNSVNTGHYIIFSDGYAWQYTNKWNEISFDKVKKNELSNVRIFNDQGLIKKTNIKYNDNKWQTGSKNEWVDYNNDFFAVVNVDKFRYISFENQQISIYDLSNVNKALSQNNLTMINNINELYYGDKIEKDIDNDGKKECIYSITNMDTEILASEYYSILFIIDDNNCQTLLIDKLNSINSLDDILDNNVYSIVDLNGDNIYELFVRKNHYAFSEKSKYFMFEYLNDKYVLVDSGN